MLIRILFAWLLAGLCDAPLLAATNGDSVPDAISCTRPEPGELFNAAAEEKSENKVELLKVTRGYIVRPDQVKKGLLEELVQQRATLLIMILDDETPRETYFEIANKTQAMGMEPGVWIEIARQPALAEQHPEWMASVGEHKDWMRDAPRDFELRENEVVKAFPWVPLWYQPAYKYHLERVRTLLFKVPESVSQIYLNNIQGGPSSCGCGNLQCRWATDYGVPATGEAISDPDLPARFVGEVEKLAGPGVKVIPNWVTECEEVDGNCGARCTGYSGGVPCFEGRCWYEMARQLKPVARGRDTIAVPLFEKEFKRDGKDIYGSDGWVAASLRSFQEILPKRGGDAISMERLLPILQGWNVTEEEQRRYERMAETVSPRGFLMSLTPIEQSWTPRPVAVEPK